MTACSRPAPNIEWCCTAEEHGEDLPGRRQAPGHLPLQATETGSRNRLLVFEQPRPGCPEIFCEVPDQACGPLSGHRRPPGQGLPLVLDVAGSSYPARSKAIVLPFEEPESSAGVAKSDVERSPAASCLLLGLLCAAAIERLLPASVRLIRAVQLARGRRNRA